MVLLSVVIDYHHTFRVLCFIGHTRACEIKRRRAAAGGLWFWFVWFAVRLSFGLCGFPFVCFPLSVAFSVAYNAFLKVSSQTFFEGVAWSSDRQKGKFFPFETLYLKIIRELSRFFCLFFGNGCKFR